ncbi:hypothetical protein KTT_60370 [Tengunoibacter tsumagoiensis]|uniref:Uncharacterized protein n=1 Tax=Tengunoibacter tsumagoiensis TaxID=2014871 RepID=A0A402AAQ0_9CHLR|nr:hypothetical protein KTT_60370 [Tengunoibacter tsumagoiensis]
MTSRHLLKGGFGLYCDGLFQLLEDHSLCTAQDVLIPLGALLIVCQSLLAIDTMSCTYDNKLRQ